MPKLNYPIKHTVNLFGGNSFQDLVIPKPEITIFTDASETGWGITDGHNPSGGQLTEPEMIHVNVQELKVVFIGIRTYGHKEAIRILALYQTALQQLHLLIIKMALSPKNEMNLRKKYGYGVLKIILSSLQLTYQKNKILKQTSFLENLTIIQNGN